MDAPCERDTACQFEAEGLSTRAGRRAAALEASGDPAEDLADLRRSGLLDGAVSAAPGASWPVLDRLRTLGRGSLPLGRLYEGHVNAVQLVAAFGTPAQRHGLDRLAGVWNTEPPEAPLRLVSAGDGRHLIGAKSFASGAGWVERPLVTARDEAGGVRMILLRLDDGGGTRADQSGWTPLGMRASASGRIDLTGLTVAEDDLIGGPGDYHRQPWFSAGAVRFAAVQLGGAEALAGLLRDHLVARGRGDDPFQQARMAQVGLAIETGRLWLERAASLNPADPGLVAHANLTRAAVERVCLDVMEATTRGIGVQALLRPHPFERILRDLTTYLRQPAPDAALAQAGRHILASDRPIHALWCPA